MKRTRTVPGKQTSATAQKLEVEEGNHRRQAPTDFNRRDALEGETTTALAEGALDAEAFFRDEVNQLLNEHFPSFEALQEKLIARILNRMQVPVCEHAQYAEFLSDLILTDPEIEENLREIFRLAK
jgi:hypothetical protein